MRDAGQLRSRLVVHQVAGRVLEFRDQVRDPRADLAYRTEQQVGVPAVGDAERVDAGSSSTERGQRVGIGRRLGQYGGAGRGEQSQREVERVLYAVGDHDLL